MNPFTPFLGGCLLLLSPAPIVASALQPAGASRISSVPITRASSPPKIDGVLEDEAWRHAEWFDDFVQKFPSNGAAPSRRTAFAVLYDDESLFFGIRCGVAEPSEIVTRMVRRDREGEFDRVEITLSPRGDDRTGYGFGVNPSGVMQDRYYGDDATYDAEWDMVWDAKTGQSDTEWRAEIEVPLDQLRFADGTPYFGLQVSRWISALRQRVVFNPIPDASTGYISTAGRLTGTQAVPARLPLVLIPESHISYETTTSGFDSRSEGGMSFGGGGYGKAGLRPDLILDMAMLPDFGQVEVDDVVLNLTAYETQFPEKRPFFLEGAGLLDTPIQLFYSRRIGQPPPSPDLGDDESLVHGGALTPILGAVKLTGRTQNGLSFGLMDTVLLPTEFVVRNDEMGHGTYRPGAPWTNAVALRTVAEMGRNSTVGVLGTALNPTESDGAYAGGIDWNVLSSRRIYAFRGQAAGSVRFEGVNGQEQSSGAGVWTKIGREGGEPIRYTASYAMYSKGFDPNDLGYLKRNDLHNYNCGLGYSFLEPIGPLKQQYLTAGFDGSRNLDGLRLQHGFWTAWSANWKNDWTAAVSAYGGLPWFDDRETRGGPPLKLPGYIGGGLSIQSPMEKVLGMLLAGEVGSTPHGVAVVVWGSLFLNLGRFNLELSPKLSESRGGLAYVDTLFDDTPGETTVAGRRDLRELNLSLKGTVVFARDLTLQIHTQLMNSSADYHHYGEVRPGGTLSPMVYRDEDGALAEGDFARTDLVLQALVRWEYLPGSTLFLIYTHKGVVDIAESGARIVDSIGGIPDEERQQIFMLKLSHRFG